MSERFWAWRARQRPRTRDDIPRLGRPPGWLPEVDQAAADRHREGLEAFGADLGRLHPADVADRVDHRLLRSTMARVRRETDILRVRALHDYVWRNGNVPVALLRWELLGKTTSSPRSASTPADGRREWEAALGPDRLADFRHTLVELPAMT